MQVRTAPLRMRLWLGIVLLTPVAKCQCPLARCNIAKTCGPPQCGVKCCKYLAKSPKRNYYVSRKRHDDLAEDPEKVARELRKLRAKLRKISTKEHQHRKELRKQKSAAFAVSADAGILSSLSNAAASLEQMNLKGLRQPLRAHQGEAREVPEDKWGVPLIAQHELQFSPSSNQSLVGARARNCSGGSWCTTALFDQQHSSGSNTTGEVTLGTKVESTRKSWSPWYAHLSIPSHAVPSRIVSLASDSIRPDLI